MSKTCYDFVNSKCDTTHLTQEEENELVGKIKNEDCEKSKLKLFHSNLDLVCKIARRHTFSEEYREDIFNEACIGLWDAIAKYEPRGNRFGSYARLIISSKIIRFLSKHSRTVRIPEAAYCKFKKIANVIEQFSNKNGYRPSAIQLSDLTGINLNTVEILLDGCQGKLSLDKEIRDDDSETFHNLVFDDDYMNDIALHDLQERIKESFHSLTEKEQTVISKRFGLNGEKELKFRQIGEILNLTKQRVEQINRQAIEKIKVNFVNKGVVSSEYV